MIFRRYLKHSWEGILKLVDCVSYFLGNMLVDKYYANVLSLFCKPVERGLDRGSFSLAIAYKEVSLRIWRICNVADTC